MAEISESDPKAVQPSDADPITNSSMSGAILIASLLLMATLGWALWDEVYGQRPWKNFQERFVAQYSRYLKRVKSRQATNAEKELRQSPEYKQLDSDYQSADAREKPRRDEIDSQVALLDLQSAAVSPVFTEARGQISVETYLAETAKSQSSKDSHLKAAEELKKEKHAVEIPTDKTGKNFSREQLDFPQLEARFNGLKDEKAKLMTERIELTRPSTELRQKRDAYLQEHLPDLSPEQIRGMVTKLDNFDYKIKQIHLPTGDLVDRCESCHLGIREPITLTRAAMGFTNGKDKEKDMYARAFTSHPDPDLLKIHNPDRFGCSTCHNGNGRATTSIAKAHGNYEHWLWPLYKRENVEAGCVQCHTKDIVLDHASTLNTGRDLFQQKGCYACHRYEGYDRDNEALFNVRQTVKQLEAEKTDNLRQSDRAKTEADRTRDNDEARRLNARSQNLVVSNSQIDARIEELDTRAKYLMWDRKMFGPNLKEIRYKLRKEWIPVWLEDPHKWRPGTKMPQFRLGSDEIQAISAYLWQSSLDGLPALPTQARGDAAHGKTLLETRGCLACHSIGEGSQLVGGHFAANLTRVGEKANYDYIVRWIHNPRERLAPYSPTDKRDLTPADYQAKNLPFTFDRDHSRSPVSGREVVWQQDTVMPNLRLSDSDTRDIATYLFSLAKETSYPNASFMDDPKLMARGASLIRNYGCASCHEIKGMEDEQRIGTELTVEGSKPIERLDFALLQHDAKAGIDPFTNKKSPVWYDNKGFFEKKLAKPDIFDQGKIKEKQDRLKMPKISFGPNDDRKKEEVTALTTFLLGSVDSAVPAALKYNPSDYHQAVQEGWWVIRKYNCMGCHNIQVGQQTILQNLPLYQSPDWKDQLPPMLLSEGARVNPDWLLHFLMDPSQSGADGTVGLDQNGKGNRNGVRKYLEVRMPTFNFSPNELRILVNFFMAASAQSQPYIREQMEPLTEQERTLARALFTSQGAPCLKCHITDDNNVKGKSAPNFTIASQRLKPGWVFRWLLDPAQISPGTAMPSGLFKHEADHDRWVFAGPTPDAFKNYPDDHARLLVRYMFQFTPEEQRRLGSGGGGGGGAGSSGPPAGQKSARKSGNSPAQVAGKRQTKPGTARSPGAFRAAR
jgi:cytochrome c2